jgi:hypothetical protein
MHPTLYLQKIHQICPETTIYVPKQRQALLHEPLSHPPNQNNAYTVTWLLHNPLSFGRQGAFPSLSGDRVFPPDVAGEAGTQTRGDPSRLDVNSRKNIFPTHATGCRVSEKTSEEPNSLPWQTVERRWA